MALTLNEEQRMLQDAAKDFFGNRMPVSELRALRDDKNADGYSKEHWGEIIDLGWPGITVADQYGGLDFGFKGLGVILEQGGRTLAATPLFATCAVGSSAIMIAGNESQKSELLPEVVEGKLLLALALEEGASHGPQRTRTTAEKSGDGFVINGTKTFVLDGHVADKLIVVARTSGAAGDADGLTLFLVDGDAKGVNITRTSVVDSRNSATIEFNNVAVAASAVLGEVDGGAAPLQDVLSIGQILISADMLGSLQEAFERTMAYIKTREQFDTIIGTKQALQHRAANMYVQIELAKSLVQQALSTLDDGVRGEELAKVASITKAKLSEVFLLTSSEGVQMFGGIGMTDDEEIGFFLKRARTTDHTLGDVRYHQNRYGDLIGL